MMSGERLIDVINRLQLLKSGQANSSPMMKFNLKDFKSHFHYQAKKSLNCQISITQICPWGFVGSNTCLIL